MTKSKRIGIYPTRSYYVNGKVYKADVAITETEAKTLKSLGCSVEVEHVKGESNVKK